MIKVDTDTIYDYNCYDDFKKPNEDIRIYKHYEKFTPETLIKYHNSWIFRLVVDQIVDLKFTLIVFGTLYRYAKGHHGTLYKNNGRLSTDTNSHEDVMLTMDRVKKDFIHVNNGTILHHINVLDFNHQMDMRTRQYYNALLNTVSYAFKLDF